MQTHTCRLALLLCLVLVCAQCHSKWRAQRGFCLPSLGADSSLCLFPQRQTLMEEVSRSWGAVSAISMFLAEESFSQGSRTLITCTLQFLWWKLPESLRWKCNSLSMFLSHPSGDVGTTGALHHCCRNKSSSTGLQKQLLHRWGHDWGLAGVG